MVSLGVGRGGSPSGAFLEGQQAALTAQSMRNQEAERAQLMQMRAAQEGRTQADFDRLEGAFAPGGIFSGAPAGGAGLDIGGLGGGFFGGAQPAQPTPGQAGIAGAFPSGGAPMRPPGSGGLAFNLLRQSEGFRETPYWDVNAYRTGYGSDTITRADGSVVRVEPGMRITREDAERDLQRRVTQEFEPRAAQQVGADIWSQLPEHVTAPLISVTYNYGSLPASVVAAVRTGDPEQIAQAVEELAGHNEGVNRRRRMEEAAIIRSGGQGPDRVPAQTNAGLAAPGSPPVQRTPATGIATQDALQGRGQAFSDYLETTRGGRSRRQSHRGLRPPEESYRLMDTLDRQAALQERASAFEPRQPSRFDPKPGTVRPRARPVVPEETFAQGEDRAIAAEQAAAREAPATERAAQPSGPSTSISMGDGTSVSIPAGLFTPQATTSDIARGASVSDAPKRMPALDAMFGDATRIGVERESLQTMMSLLQQQLEFARQIRDPRMVFELTGQMALAQTRMRSLGLVQAGAEARTNNFDPMAQALSQMTGQQVQITPLAGGRVNVTVDGNLVQSNVPADQVISAYRAGVDEVYQQQIAAQAAEQSRRSGAFFDMYLSAAEEAMKQEAQGTREMQVEAFKRSLDAQLGADPALFTEKVTDQTTGEETVIVYDRNNPGAPMQTIRFRENPLVPGQFEPVRGSLTNMR